MWRTGTFLSAGGAFEGQFDLNGGRCEASDVTWALSGGQKMELLEDDKASPEAFVRGVLSRSTADPPLTTSELPNTQIVEVNVHEDGAGVVCLRVHQTFTVPFLFFLSHSDKDGVCRAV